MSTDAVVIWGEILWDRFPDGEQLGGAPANVAWHLGQAGSWAQLVSRVGDDDDGRRAIARLSELVDTSLVQLDPERATGEVRVTIEHGEPRYQLVPDRAWQFIAFTPAVATAIAEAGVFVYGTLAQRTAAGLASWREAIEAARHCTKVCDLNLRPGDEYRTGIANAFEQADIVKVNDRELGQLRAWLGWPDPVARLRERSKLVVVTHGAGGSTLHSEHGVLEIAAIPPARAVDNVGCGDAYLAILVHGLTSGWDLEASARAASRWAGAVAGVRGATPMFSDEQVAELLEAA